jgi:hypothetical protein
MIKVSLCLSGYESTTVPEITVFHNQQPAITLQVVGKQQWIDFEIEPVEENLLTIDFYNKKPHHTIVKDGKIVEDLWIELHKIRVDDIQLQTWFLDDGWYRPRYFDEFLKDFPDSPERLASQRIWHFPGAYHLCAFPVDFWSWYHFERNNHITLANMDKDLHRWEKFVGSIERYQEIVDEIKELCRA